MNSLNSPLKQLAMRKWEKSYFMIGKRPTLLERVQFLSDMRVSPTKINGLVQNYLVLCLKLILNVPIQMFLSQDYSLKTLNLFIFFKFGLNHFPDSELDPHLISFPGLNLRILTLT